MSTALGPIAPEIKVNGVALKADAVNQLIRLRVERGFGMTGRATLRFADAGYALATTDQFKLGNTLTIGLPGSGQLISGTVTGVGLEQDASGHPYLSVTADDAAYKLARGTKNRTFLQTTVQQAVTKVLQEAGLEANIGTGTSGQLDYLLQAGNDLAFIDSLVTRVGGVWFVDGETFTVTKAGESSGTASVSLHQDLIEFNVRASGIRPDSLDVNGWDPHQKLLVTASKSAPSTGVAADTTFTTPYTSGAGLGVAPADYGTRSPINAAEATELAQSLFDEWISEAVMVRATAYINPALKPGIMLSVQNAGPASGSYLITRVEHDFGPSGFFTKIVCGGHRRTGLADALTGSRSDGGLSMAGLVVGIVTNINDELNIGRIKVKYGGLDDTIESAWARVVAIGAGAARGGAFMPEVNDEVLVGFEHGDSRRPIVLGGLYSQNNTLADFGLGDSKVTARRLTSRNGHVIEMSDGDADTDAHVLLKLGVEGYQVRLGKDRFDVEVPSGKPVMIKAGSASFEITNAGDINISAANVSIKASAQLNLEGNAGATLKSGGQTAVQGPTVSVKGDAMASVEASGQLALKGAIVQIN